ncbi:hypothetical protein L7F22_052745 [Adiantum nelumboides]|nr:hypothetical protein [Adiantum nelumboides]
MASYNNYHQNHPHYDRYHHSSPHQPNHPTFAGQQYPSQNNHSNTTTTRYPLPVPPINANGESVSMPPQNPYGYDNAPIGEPGPSSLARYSPFRSESDRSPMMDPGSFSSSRPMNSSSVQENDIAIDSQNKVKRAKSAQKITRNRKITSCLQCRERKQKCDRKRPVCSNCVAGNSRGGMCTYVDTAEGVQEVLANEGEKDAKRVKRSPSEETIPSVTQMPAPMRPMLPARSPLTIRRLHLIAATAQAGRDPSLEFEVRVRYARAAAVGSILFGTPQIGPGAEVTSQLYQPLAAVDSLKLPTSAEIGPLLDTYRRHIEWMCNVVLVDLNRARFESFLNWWHSNPQTLPADPPLIPLVLTILALAIQARRMSAHCTLLPSAKNRDQKRNEKHFDRDGTTNGIRAQSPKQQHLRICSSEKELLETAQRCIDVLQIACPSNWASAFSAPLDLVRASLLRGVWHMTELHLQFGGSCFATTMRLAHAASLNHDTRHWPSMGKEESQARRNIFWNVATFEVMFSMRVIQPSMILPTSYDTKFPDDYDALVNLYRYGGLVEPYIVEGRRSHFRVTPVTKNSFDYHSAKFKLTDILIKGQEDLRSGDKGRLAEAHEQWKKELPKELKKIIDHGGSRSLGKDNHPIKRKYDIPVLYTPVDNELDTETHFLQAAMLQMLDLSASIQIHRPQADEAGRWRAPEGQSQRSLEICIDSAQRLIWLVYSVIMRDPGPPYILYHQCVFNLFQAAIAIAIESAISSSKERTTNMTTAQSSLQKAIELLDTVARAQNLRYVAEQAGKYAATLREMEETRKNRLKGKTGSGAHTPQNMRNNDASMSSNSHTGNESSGPSRSSIHNAQKAALGVPILAVAEGDGKMLGGQGYPLGKSGSSSNRSSPFSTSSTANRSGQNNANKFTQSRPYPQQVTQQSVQQLPQQNTPASSIRFSDMGRPIQAILPELQGLQIPGIDFLSEGGNAAGLENGLSMNGAIPSMQTFAAPQASFGIDFHDLQVFGHAENQSRYDSMPDDTFAERPFSNANHLNSNMNSASGTMNSSPAARVYATSSTGALEAIMLYLNFRHRNHKMM